MTSTYDGSWKQEGNTFEGFASDMATKTIGVAIKSSQLAVSPPLAKLNSSVTIGATVSKIMDPVPRPELDAKLEAVEARMDGRIAELAGKIDGYIGRMEERDKRNDERFESMTVTLTDVRSEIRDTKNLVGSMKTTVITTGVGAVIAIVFGVAAFNATVLSNMVASFESGKNTAMAVSDAAKRLEHIQDRIEAQQKKPVK